MKDIFVSYRRGDSQDVTGRICDNLTVRLGDDRLFKDVDSIPFGIDFRSVIADAVGQCRVMLAVIGDDWLTATDESGRRRIDNPDDFVHVEIATALARGVPVIPVLVEGASLPRADELPGSLKGLAFRQAAHVRPDPDFRADIDRLCQQLAGHTAARTGLGVLPKKSGRVALWLLGGVLAFGVLAFAAKRLFFGEPDRPPVDTGVAVEPTEDATDAARPADRVPLRYWVKALPDLRGDGEAMLAEAAASWKTVADVPIRAADSESTANVIIDIDPRTIAVADFGPPTRDGRPLRMLFGTDLDWTDRGFRAAACRLFGHTLGLNTSETPGQLMTEGSMPPEDLPLSPQTEDIERVRKIWEN